MYADDTQVYVFIEGGRQTMMQFRNYKHVFQI